MEVEYESSGNESPRWKWGRSGWFCDEKSHRRNHDQDNPDQAGGCEWIKGIHDATEECQRGDHLHGLCRTDLGGSFESHSSGNPLYGLPGGLYPDSEKEVPEFRPRKAPLANRPPHRDLPATMNPTFHPRNENTTPRRRFVRSPMLSSVASSGVFSCLKC